MQAKSQRYWFVVIVSLTALVMLVGCTQSPEQSPVFRKLMSDFTTLQEEMVDVKDQVRRMSADMTALTEEVTKLSQRPEGKGLDEAQLKQLNDQLSQLSSKISTLEKELSSVKASSASRASASPAVSEKPTATTAERPAESRTEPKGSYYTIEKGDTLEGIAKKFNVTVDAIRMANPAIPADGKIIAGNNLFIPRGR